MRALPRKVSKTAHEEKMESNTPVWSVDLGTRNYYQEQLPGTTARNYYQELPPRTTTTRNYYQEQLPGITTSHYYQELVPVTTTKN